MTTQNPRLGGRQKPLPEAIKKQSLTLGRRKEILNVFAEKTGPCLQK